MNSLPDVPDPGPSGFTAKQLQTWIMDGAPPPTGPAAAAYFDVALGRLVADNISRNRAYRHAGSTGPRVVSLHSHLLLLNAAPPDWDAGLKAASRRRQAILRPETMRTA
jgi:hypothetical protein